MFPEGYFAFCDISRTDQGMRGCGAMGKRCSVNGCRLHQRLRAGVRGVWGKVRTRCSVNDCILEICVSIGLEELAFRRRVHDSTPSWL
jgi:hypothetical protein